MNSMPKQRRESEANGPRGQRPPGASRTGPPVRRSSSEGGSRTEFVRPAHQAVAAIAAADMINRAEPRACGHSREPTHLDSEPDTERNASSASNAAGDGCGRARSDQAGLQPYRGKLAVRDETRGRGKRGQDLMAVCHDARKGRNTGSQRSKPVAPPLHSTSNSRGSPFHPRGRAETFKTSLESGFEETGDLSLNSVNLNGAQDQIAQPIRHNIGMLIEPRQIPMPYAPSHSFPGNPHRPTFRLRGRQYQKLTLSMAGDEDRYGTIFMAETEVVPDPLSQPTQPTDRLKPSPSS